jgi:hypothetical protein
LRYIPHKFLWFWTPSANATKGEKGRENRSFWFVAPKKKNIRPYVGLHRTAYVPVFAPSSSLRPSPAPNAPFVPYDPMPWRYLLVVSHVWRGQPGELELEWMPKWEKWTSSGLVPPVCMDRNTCEQNLILDPIRVANNSKLSYRVLKGWVTVSRGSVASWAGSREERDDHLSLQWTELSLLQLSAAGTARHPYTSSLYLH